MRNNTGKPIIEVTVGSYNDLERRALHLATQTILALTNVTSTTVVVNTTLDNAAQLVLVDCSGGQITITLPAVTEYPYKQYRIKKIDNTLNPVRVISQANETIDGESEWFITFPNDCMDVVSDSDETWRMV